MAINYHPHLSTRYSCDVCGKQLHLPEVLHVDLLLSALDQDTYESTLKRLAKLHDEDAGKDFTEPPRYCTACFTSQSNKNRSRK